MWRVRALVFSLTSGSQMLKSLNWTPELRSDIRGRYVSRSLPINTALVHNWHSYVHFPCWRMKKKTSYSSSHQLENWAPRHYGEGNRRCFISTVLSASLTMALINALHPPKAPPVRMAIKMIICRAAANFHSNALAEKEMHRGLISPRTCTKATTVVNIVTF